MTKVVRIIARMNMGGPARHCMTLGRGLREHGFETVLLAGDLDDGEVPLEDRPDGGPGFRLEHVPGLGRPPSPSDDLRALLAILRALRRERPQIVHTHTAKAGALGRLAARLCGVPVVVHTFHGHVLSGYFSPLSSSLVTLAERALARITARIVTLSPGLRDELAGEYGIAGPERFEVIPLGRDLGALVDPPRGRLRAELGLGADEVLVGCVGRLVPIKRVCHLVRAFGRIAGGAPRAHLVIVGDGTERARVAAAVAAEGLAGRVHLLGWRDDLPAIYGDLDLLALSSRNEGTPLAIIEAFASGVPVVATAVGGVPDMFTDLASPAAPALAGVSLRDQGALVAPDDVPALAVALELLCGRPDLRQAAAAGALAASTRYSEARLVGDVAGLYRRLLAGG